MANLEQAVENMIDMCNNNQHGYDQARRWGPDYDCSSSIITALRNAGFDTGSATYTGNMSANLCARGWTRLYPSVAKQRGDILLNDVDHVALFLGNNQLAQFSNNERGGVTGGRTGDQTGGEARIQGYYNYPWNCILRYQGSQTSTVKPLASRQIDVYYAVMLKNGKKLPFVKNREDYAGTVGKEVTGLAIKVSAGSVEYEVHTQANGWLGKVTGCDFNDVQNGYAGDGKNAIDMVKIYLHSPGGSQCIYYCVSPLGKAYFPCQKDTDVTNQMDGYAGDSGQFIDRIQMYVS